MGLRQFENLWGIILGGSSGFGLATVYKLAAHGMNLAIVYREMATRDKLLREECSVLEKKHGIKILCYNINALDDEHRDRAVAEMSNSVPLHSVRLLVHSIARGNLKPLTNQGHESELLSAQDIQLTIYAMSTSLLDWTRAILKLDLFHSNSRIVGLTSEGANKYWKGYGAVSMAKQSLQSLAKYMAVEFCSVGIRTNLIQAGVTRTPSMERIPDSETLVERATKRNPMQRMTIPEDVANVIYLLCLDEAAWINGSTIHVDGGEHCC